MLTDLWLTTVSVFLLLTKCQAGYLMDRWSDDNSVFDRQLPTTKQPSTSRSSNLGCFLCTQLLSVTKHRVGLSQNQLRNVLYEKCRVLPQVLREQCFTFVDTSLPEIYFSLNYDLSSKNVCVTLNLCDENNSFALATPTPPPNQDSTPYPDDKEHVPLPATEPTLDRRPLEPPTNRLNSLKPINSNGNNGNALPHPPPHPLGPMTQVQPTYPPPRNGPERIGATERTTAERMNKSMDRKTDRIGHKNVDIRERIDREREQRESEMREREQREREREREDKDREEKRLTCKFCERMLENAKSYAVTAKTDITSFANNACAKLQKGRYADQCYELADKKIEELAKFVDHQVIEALWCAELNHC